MINNIVNTISSKFGLAVFAILMLLLNSNVLGSEGLGAVGIIVLEISIYLLVINLVCGGSIIFYASRYKVIELLLFSYLWILIITLLFGGILLLFPEIISQYAHHILVLGILQAIIGVHSNVLVGKNKIKAFNQIAIFQATIQIVALITFYFILNQKTIEAFIYSTYIAYALALIFSFMRVSSLIERSFSFLSYHQLKPLFNYGFYIQIANVSQLLNYRLSYFLLKFYSGIAAVGLFMPSVQLSEGLLLPSKSIGMVQYSKIATTRSDKKSALLSLRLLKLVFLITVPVTLILILIPSWAFQLVLGDDFSSTPTIIALMSIGIVALAGEIILSRYFSGTGNQKVNAISSAIGLMATVIAGFILIPKMGLYGAAITTSISYSCMYLFMFYKIIKCSDLSLSDFWITKADFLFIKRIVRNLKRGRLN